MKTMKTTIKEKTYHCDFCKTTGGPSLPPNWNEYSVDLDGPTTEHLCAGCSLIVMAETKVPAPG